MAISSTEFIRSARIAWPSAESPRLCGNEHPYDSFLFTCDMRAGGSSVREFVVGPQRIRMVHTAMVVRQLYLPSVPSRLYQLYPRLGRGRRARAQVICHHHHHRRHRRRCYPRGDGSGTGSHSPDGLRLITPVRDARMVRCHSLRTARAEFRTVPRLIDSIIFENLMTTRERKGSCGTLSRHYDCDNVKKNYVRDVIALSFIVGFFINFLNKNCCQYYRRVWSVWLTKLNNFSFFKCILQIKKKCSFK